MNIRHSLLLGTSLLLSLAGCGTAPLSVLESHPYHRTNMHREPLTIVAINGQYGLERSWRVFPGANTLVVEARPVGGMRLPKQQTVPFEVAPCTRYYLAAERENSLSPDWKLVVDHQEAVTGCSPQEEIAKAKREGIPLDRIVSRTQTGNPQ